MKPTRVKHNYFFATTTNADIQRDIDVTRTHINNQIRREYEICMRNKTFRHAIEYLLRPVVDVMQLVA